MAGFPSESSLVLFKNSGPWRRLDAASLQTTAASEDSEVPANGFTVGAAQDGSYAGYAGYGQVKVWRTSGAMSSPSAHLRGTAPDSPARSFAISADGRKAAVAEGDGTIFVIPLTTGPASVSNPVQLTGNGDTHLMTFLGAGGRLAAAAGATIALWDPGQVSRLSAPPGVPVPPDSHAGPPPALLSPPHGRWLALVEEVAGAWLITDGHRRQAAEQPQWPPPWELPIRRGDTPLLIGMTANNDTGAYTSLVLATAAGHIFRSWPAPSGTPVAAGMLPSGNQFAVVGSDGSVSLYDISSRKVRQRGPERGGLPAGSGGQPGRQRGNPLGDG